MSPCIITGSSSSPGPDTSADDKLCANFLLHKNCAELSSVIQNPTYVKEILSLSFNHSLPYRLGPGIYRFH